MTSPNTERLARSIAAQSRAERVPPSHIVGRAFVAELEEATVQEAARVGLVRLANDVLHRERNGGGGVEVATELEADRGSPVVVQPGMPHPKDWGRIFDRIVLATADGEQLLPVHEIPVDELEAIARRYQGKAEAYERCRSALAEVVVALRKKKVDTIAELPDREQRKLSSVLATAWGT